MSDIPPRARTRRDVHKRTALGGGFFYSDRMPSAPFTRSDPAQWLLPGAYEPRTPNHRQAGAMGGAAFGRDDVASAPGTMSARTIAEREKEGGGGVETRR